MPEGALPETPWSRPVALAAEVPELAVVQWLVETGTQLPEEFARPWPRCSCSPGAPGGAGCGPGRAAAREPAAGGTAGLLSRQAPAPAAGGLRLRPPATPRPPTRGSWATHSESCLARARPWPRPWPWAWSTWRPSWPARGPRRPGRAARCRCCSGDPGPSCVATEPRWGPGWGCAARCWSCTQPSGPWVGRGPAWKTGCAVNTWPRPPRTPCSSPWSCCGTDPSREQCTCSRASLGGGSPFPGLGLVIGWTPPSRRDQKASRGCSWELGPKAP